MMYNMYGAVGFFPGAFCVISMQCLPIDKPNLGEQKRINAGDLRALGKRP